MKTKISIVTRFALAATVGLLAPNVFAEDAAPAPAVAQTAAAPTPTLVLSAGAAEVLQLQQAKISETTLLTFIQNSPATYALDAGQIIYLKQQGVPDGVVTAMLSHKPAAAAAASTANATSTATVTRTVYVQQPVSTVYYAPEPYGYGYYPGYYPYYGWPSPGVSVSVGFGGGFRGGYRGGGGWHHR
jgi:hypothetical protein